MTDWAEIALRLGVATLACGAVGLNRDLRDKPVGVRTLGLVGLSTAMLVILVDGPASLVGEINRFSDAASRVMQGILTGIGFLGAGVILHSEKHRRIHGLTSAACVWFTASIGMACGAGWWPLVAISLVLAFAVLILGGPIERRLHFLFTGTRRAPHGEPPSTTSEPPRA